MSTKKKGVIKYSCSKQYWWGAASWLGVLNTVLRRLFNRVVIRVIDRKSGKTIRWRWGKAADFFPHDRKRGPRPSRQKQKG